MRTITRVAKHSRDLGRAGASDEAGGAAVQVVGCRITHRRRRAGQPASACRRRLVRVRAGTQPPSSDSAAALPRRATREGRPEVRSSAPPDRRNGPCGRRESTAARPHGDAVMSGPIEAVASGPRSRRCRGHGSGPFARGARAPSDMRLGRDRAVGWMGAERARLWPWAPMGWLGREPPAAGMMGAVVLYRAQLHDSERQNADPECDGERCNDHRPVSRQPIAHGPKDALGSLPHDRDHDGNRDQR
jgi:hypothetical protein